MAIRNIKGREVSDITKSQVDLVQGETEWVGVKNGGLPFGFVHGEDGGLFFTWMDTLETTLATLEPCDIDGDGGLDTDEVAAFLREYLPTTSRGKKMWGSDE